ncbi:MAG: ADP-ribosylglycohydrolase family protein [Christensenellales bacterium]|jgi:ADP-ribosylglycohydrolase
MAGWDALRELFYEELQQLKEEGRDVSGAWIPETEDDDSFNHAYDQLMRLPLRPDFPYMEPVAGEEVWREAERPAPKKLCTGTLFQKLYAAWVGRAAGCALGKPVEIGMYMNGGLGRRGWENVRKWFADADAYPITSYTPGHSRAEADGLLVRCPRSWRENICFMESDDDVRYTVLGLALLEEKGFSFSTWDVGKNWHARLTYGQVCTAETQAYLNFAAVTSHIKGDEPEDAAEKLDWVRSWRNPYREWIGAQIRVDAYGYAGAGDPALAAELARRDAELSHVRNGVYGAMFCAAMIAAAFTANSAREIVETGLKVVPKRSRLYEAIEDTLSWAEEEQNPEVLCDRLWDAWGNYNGVHTINNASLCAAALLSSGGDYEKAITTSVLCGWDTDCNGATVGSIMGAWLGEVPEKWAAPLQDTMYSQVSGFDPITFTDIAARTLEVIKKNRPEVFA